MSQIAIQITPLDHGRRMTLAEFDCAEGHGGHIYELGRGIVTVVNIPDRKHFAMVDAARRQFYAYQHDHPDQIENIGGGRECKILLADLESERHPDVAIYKTPPVEDQDLWATWIPEIVIEVVSAGSEHRDYIEKREEYLRFGIREYWIIDARKQEMLVLRRSGGRWVGRIVRNGETYRTRLLPEFSFELQPVFTGIS